MEPLLLPGHPAVGSSSPIYLLSLKVPPLASEAGQPAPGGPPLPWWWLHSYLSGAEALLAVSGSESAGCRATRLHPKGVLNAPSASLQANNKGSRDESEHRNWRLQHIYWRGIHRPEKVSATPLATQPAPG